MANTLPKEWFKCQKQLKRSIRIKLKTKYKRTHFLRIRTKKLQSTQGLSLKNQKIKSVLCSTPN